MDNRLRFSDDVPVRVTKLNERLEKSVTIQDGFCTIVSTPLFRGNSTRYSFVIGYQLRELFPGCKHEVPVTANRGSTPSRSEILETATTDCR